MFYKLVTLQLDLICQILPKIALTNGIGKNSTRLYYSITQNVL